MACVQGLGDTVHVLLDSSVSDPGLWLSPEVYQAIWGGILKQGAERLDNVRAEVGRQIMRLLKALEAKKSQGPHYEPWLPNGSDLMLKLFLTE